MRKDHRPFYIKSAYLRLQRIYAHRFIRPQLAHMGRGCMFMKPWYVEIFGEPISIGDYAVIIATPDHRVRLSIWPPRPGAGRIRIGDYALICPGARLSAAGSMRIGDSCMLANGVYITDADWHDLYDRTAAGPCRPVTLEDNVWVGDSAIICKGAHIGQNSVIGAGSVVTGDIPDNVVAAGNPARVVKTLDPGRPLVTRADWFARPAHLAADIERLDRMMLKDNSLLHWLRHMAFPKAGE